MATKIKMDRSENDIQLPIASPSKSVANLIEWKVDMKVTISNVRKSKILQRSRNLIIFIMAVLFAIVSSHLKREVKALQVQIHYMNVNLLVLMSKYDRLNRNLNRVWFQQDGRFYKTASSINRHTTEHAKRAEREDDPSEIFDVVHSSDAIDASSYTYSAVAPFVNTEMYSENNIAVSDTVNANMNNDSIIKVPSPNVRIVNRVKRGTVLRFEKDALVVANKSSTQSSAQRANGSAHDDDVVAWKEPRSGRSRRDEGRGKKRRKNRRRPKRSPRRLGPLIATFVGAIPEQHVTDTVHIGPWVRSNSNDSQYNFNRFHLVEDKKSVEVTMSGLYMISVQIFYFGEPKNYSYWILLSSEGASTTRKLAKCATASAVSAAEVSCYTSVITLLRKGDRLHVQQQERDRLINMREGHSYIQVALLSGIQNRRRLS